MGRGGCLHHGETVSTVAGEAPVIAEERNFISRKKKDSNAITQENASRTCLYEHTNLQFPIRVCNLASVVHICHVTITSLAVFKVSKCRSTASFEVADNDV